MSERAKGWEPGDGGNALHEQLQREHDSAFDAGFKAGSAASTRAAVIAELEEAQVQARSAEGYFEFSAWLTERLVQLRAEQEAPFKQQIEGEWTDAEQGNEQTGEGDNVGS